jgi:class 3 adenylate cyclase
VEPTSLGSGNRICTVVFVDIVQYSRESVSRQAELKTWFSEILTAALQHTPAADRMVVDAGDGAALCFLGDPADALFAANTLRTRALEGPQRDVQLRLGINLGPVRVVKDINGHENVIGDGINVAQRVMGFAEPNQILVSRSYYEVVSRLAPDYGNLFQYAGLHRDKHVREHEVYEVQMAPSVSRTPIEPAGPAPTPDEPAAPPEPAGAARFDPAVLERLATALALEIGPVAKLIVRREAERAADARALAERIVEHVPDERRAGFMARISERSGARAATEPPAGGASGTGPAEPRPARAVEPEVLSQAEHLLARRIGPLARILVRQAAKHAATSRELFDRLALHIEDATGRQAFLAEAERYT